MKTFLSFLKTPVHGTVNGVEGKVWSSGHSEVILNEETHGILQGPPNNFIVCIYSLLMRCRECAVIYVTGKALSSGELSCI